MPFNISNQPRGLNTLLALFEKGQAPSSLTDNVQGVVDLRDQYLLNLRQYHSFAIVGAPVVGNNFFGAPLDTVPPGELWFVWHYLIVSTLAAGEAIDFLPSFSPDGNDVSCPVGDFASGAALQQVRAYARSPFWAGPGSRFNFIVRSLTAAPDVFGALVVTKLRV